MDAPDLFDSPGFRAYLREWSAWKKASSKSFSLRQFALRAGFSSHSFLPKILDGSRNLTEASTEQVIAALGLNQAQSRFFRLLVLHDQAIDPGEREALHEKLHALRRVRHRRRLGTAQANYYEHWYYPVLRHIAPHAACGGDPARLGALLEPPVPGAEVARALEDLAEMGLLERDGNRWMATDSVVTVDQLPHSVKTKGRHDILQKGIESLHRFAPDERFTRCVLLSLDQDGWDEVREILDDAARRSLEIAARDQKPRRIGQVVVQLFPLSRKLSP